MKQGKTLQELAVEIDRQANAKHDYIATGEALRMDEGKLLMTNGHTQSFSLTDLGHAQLAERLSIPKKYYDDMRINHPKLLDITASYLLPAKKQNHLVRTLDTKVRAILSEKYRCLDNKPLITSILPTFLSSGFELVSSEITDTRFYLKVISPRLMAEFPVKSGGHTMINEVVRAGFWIQNSEVGHSRLSGGLFIEVLRCTNGMMMSSEFGFAKNHSGKAIDFSDAVESYFSNETRQLDDRAYWAKLKDVVNGMIGSDQGFKSAVERFRIASQEQIQGNPVKAVEKVQEIFALNKDEGDGILKALIAGGDLSRWGLTNALTSYSQSVADYDRATDFERLGGKVIELNKKDWETISLAA